MAEMGKRQLTAASLLKIADLQLRMNVSCGQRMELLRKKKAKGSGGLPAAATAARQSRCNYKLFMLQGNLRNMSDQYDKLAKSLEVLENIIAIRTPDAPDYIFWKWQEQRAFDKMERCGLLRQDQLQLRIKMPETEGEYYK